MAKRPNILLVMADQHRADVVGCAGDTTVHTPNLDALAARGLHFTRVSCQGPLCMPARASFLTERYVRDHGVYTNWAEVPHGTPTYLHALQAAGYHTVMIGKAHLTRDDDLDVAHMDELAPYLHERGFIEVHETGDKFTVEPTRYTDHLAARGLLDGYKQHIADRSYHGENESGQGATKQVPMWDATPTPLPLDAYVDTWHGAAAEQWIRDYDRDEPFFCFVGFPGPHDPWDAPPEALEQFGPDTPRMPASTQRPELDGLGNYGKLLRGMLALSDTDTMDDAAIRGMRRAYAANVGVIDAAVGRILGALEERGLRDDTWVIYTSDHGEMGGDHGLMSKCVLYTQAVRVPLIVQPPGGCAPQQITALVEHLDVPATVRAIAGAPDVQHSDGRSLLGHLDGTAGPGREVAISENWGFAVFETERYRLVVDEDRRDVAQLFDLHTDPHEDTDLARDPAYAGVVAELLERFVEPFLAVTPVRPHPSPFG
jgi:choline-sulfatase